MSLQGNLPFFSLRDWLIYWICRLDTLTIETTFADATPATAAAASGTIFKLAFAEILDCYYNVITSVCDKFSTFIQFTNNM